MCGLCIFPDKLCVCACRLSSSPPCLSPAPVQTCLPRACPWRVRCPASKPSASGASNHFPNQKRRKVKMDGNTMGKSTGTPVYKKYILYIRKGIILREGFDRRVQSNECLYILAHWCTCCPALFNVIIGDVPIKIFLKASTTTLATNNFCFSTEQSGTSLIFYTREIQRAHTETCPGK